MRHVSCLVGHRHFAKAGTLQGLSKRHGLAQMKCMSTDSSDSHFFLFIDLKLKDLFQSDNKHVCTMPYIVLP